MLAETVAPASSSHIDISMYSFHTLFLHHLCCCSWACADLSLPKQRASSRHLDARIHRWSLTNLKGINELIASRLRKTSPWRHSFPERNLAQHYLRYSPSNSVQNVDRIPRAARCRQPDVTSHTCSSTPLAWNGSFLAHVSSGMPGHTCNARTDAAGCRGSVQAPV